MLSFMHKLPSIDNCCGCAECIDICPKNAISLVEDKNTFYKISVNRDLCVECHLCEKSCQALHPEILQFSNPRTVTPLAAWSTDEKIIKQSASGGIFAQIASNMLDAGNVYVYGAALCDDNSVKHIEISSKEDLVLLQNSKYQQSVSTGIYRKVKQRLDEGYKVLFSGVSCQIAALLLFLRYKEDYLRNLYTIDVLCHGVPCNDLHRTALKYNRKKRIVAYRTKGESGWAFGGNNRVTYEDMNGKITSMENTIKDSLYRSYLSFALLRLNCYSCKFAGPRRISDLTIGDFWGFEKSERGCEYTNHMGTSFALPNTKKGEEMMKGANLHTVDTTWRDIMPYNSNLIIPTNDYYIILSKYIYILKRLPVFIKTFIYQNGFNFYRVNIYYEKFFKFFFGNKERANEIRTAKLKEHLNWIYGKE